jgi:hypothetical protein
VEPFVPFVIHFIPFVIFIKCLYDPKLLFKLYTAIYRPFVPFVVPFVPFVPFVQFVQFSTAGLVGGKTKKQKISLLFFPPTNQKPSCSTFIHCFLVQKSRFKKQKICSESRCYLTLSNCCVALSKMCVCRV